MGDISKFGKGQESHGSGHVDDSSTCPVCDGKKYTLVATRKVNQTHTVLERQDCHLCVAVNKPSPVEKTNESSRGGRKRLSGTGYLRTKKRRRREESQGNPS